MRWVTLILIFVSLNCVAQTVQNFSLTNVVDGSTVSLNDYSSSEGVVIVFTGTTCPYNQYYATRIKELAELYKSKTPLLLINSNNEESVDQMKQYVEQNKLSIPYLADPEQKVLLNLNPRKNPECFLLQRTGEKFIVAYRGAIDDNAQAASAVNHAYLKDAITNLLAKRKIEPVDVRPVGCSIRKN